MKKEAKEETVKTEPRPDPSNRSGRKRRSAVGGARDFLNVVGDLDQNYNYRIANDEGSRISELEGYGYEVDQSKHLHIGSSNPTQSGSSHTVVVDRNTGQKGVLMRQPKEYHEEDQTLRAAAIDKSEESMFRELKTEEGRYGDIENSNSLARKLDD